MKTIEVSNQKGKFILLDDDDYEKVKTRKWCRGKNTFCGSFNDKTVSLIRYIIGANENEKIFYKNSNFYDCRRSNLEIRNKVIISVTNGFAVFKFFDGTIGYTDACFYDIVKDFNWYIKKRNNFLYIIRYDKEKILYLHREINNTPEELFTDHINGNTLDNRQCNLRTCTLQQNSFNCRKRQRKKTASKYKGVKFRSKKWEANINYNRKRIYLGGFDTEEEAAIAYNKEAVKLFGEFACLNEIPITNPT